jgi:hypothetical protein
MLPLHPLIHSRPGLLAGVVLILLGMALLGGLLVLYGDFHPYAALADAFLYVGLLAVCGILSWFFYAYVRVWQAQIAMTLLIQAICLGSCYTVVSVAGLAGAGSFERTLPLQLTTGILYWIVLMQRYHILHLKGEKEEQEKIPAPSPPPAREAAVEWLDRIPVKDGVRIHLVALDELLYIQASGDYVTLFTHAGQYVKEQTMKYFDTHLPPGAFVRIHRSTIVNARQILRVELFGKESYNVRLKNGSSLRASGAGYKLLKERLGL